MNKLFLVIIVFFSISNLFGQSLELFGGVNRTSFYNRVEDDYFAASYQPGLGYSLGLGFDLKKTKAIYWRFTLSFENYNGEIFEKYIHKIQTSTESVDISKNCLNIGVYPLSFNIKEKLKINFGFEFSYLLVDNSSRPVSAPVVIGLRSRLAYEINISDELSIQPQFHYYIGLTNETTKTASNSMRFYFLVGVAKKFS